MDGSVGFIKDSVSLDAMRALCTCNHAEIVASNSP
jgi:hypothetical protein